MDYHIDRRVRLVTSTEYPALYTWALQELDEDGDSKQRDQIPWRYSTWFECDNLTFHIELTSDTFLKNEAEDSTNVEECEFIRGIFHPHQSDNPFSIYNETSFSFFGTSREIKNFDVRIEPSKEGDKESCVGWGSLAHTFEWDFENKDEPDTVMITLTLGRERFKKIKQLVLMDTSIKASLRLSKVNGFYSDWSPSIRTSNIKILANVQDQKIDIPNGSEINLPVLGNISDFTFRVWQSSKQLKQEAPDREDHDEADFLEDELVSNVVTKAKNENEIIVSNLNRLNSSFKSMNYLLWAILVILLIQLIS